MEPRGMDRFQVMLGNWEFEAPALEISTVLPKLIILRTPQGNPRTRVFLTHGLNSVLDVQDFTKKDNWLGGHRDPASGKPVPAKDS
eukprot:6229228-Amphidinium_carterae.1